MSKEQFIVITSRVVSGSNGGFDIEHYSGPEYATKNQAIRAGFLENESDDFNVGVVQDGVLKSIWWMDEQIDEPELPSIAATLGYKSNQESDQTKTHDGTEENQ